MAIPTLKETIAADIDLVIDPDDFAETAIVESKSIKVMFDSDRLGELTGHAQYAMGLDAVVMFARTEDLPPARKPGDALMIGSYDWTVMSWEDRAGVSEIALQRSR
ncbi:MAG: hypothetical protein IJ087_01670 [Eggerthellaceae bacterium]|nr:hypothetical protein [Eggerthellaceae bacterium]